MKRNVKITAFGALLAAAAIGGTWAYFNQELTAANMFDTGTYDTELVEEFKPSDGENWQPGVSVNKDVTVRNTGTLPVVVRVKFEEKWVSRTEDGSEGRVLYEMDTTKDKEALGKDKPTASPADAANKFETVYQGNPNDGVTGSEVDDSVVYKQMPNLGSFWFYNDADGWYYYYQTIPGVSEDGDGNQVVTETEVLLDGVTLSENTDMGLYRESKWYAVTETKPEDGSEDWIEFATVSDASRPEGYSYLSTREMNEKVKKEDLEHPDGITFMKSATRLSDGELGGYSNADYTLTVTAQTVQATEHAINALFGGGSAFAPPAGCSWELVNEDHINE